MVRPALRRDVVAVLRGSYRISERRACSAMGFHRSAQAVPLRELGRALEFQPVAALSALKEGGGLRHPLLELGLGSGPNVDLGDLEEHRRAQSTAGLVCSASTGRVSPVSTRVRVASIRA